MMHHVRKPPILVVDPDKAFLGKLSSDPKAASLKPLTAENAVDAQRLLADRDQPIAGIFIHAELPSPGCISLIRFAHQHRPMMLIFILHDGILAYEEHDLKLLPIQKILPKPIEYAKMMGLVAPTALALGQEIAADIEAGKLQPDSKNTGDSAYLPISARDFLSGAKAIFDIYVRLSPDRYLKILQMGDTFTPDRLQNYLDKGVTHFYLRKEAQERYLAYCDQLATAAIKHQSISKDIKLTQAMNHGQETISFLRNQGLSETNLQYASNFIENVQTLVDQVNPGKDPLFKGFLSNVEAYEHGVGTAMIASLMAKALKIESDRATQIVGMASLLHDIGLEKMPEKFKDEDQSKMTPEETTLFQTHPLVGAQILREIKRINPAVIQAVAEHHERRNRTGFPSRISASQLSPVGEIVGLSDEFLMLLGRTKDKPGLNIIKELELKIFPGFSRSIIDIFRSVFLVQ